jgi:hypothetical protein
VKQICILLLVSKPLKWTGRLSQASLLGELILDHNTNTSLLQSTLQYKPLVLRNTFVVDLKELTGILAHFYLFIDVFYFIISFGNEISMEFVV